MFYCSQIYNLTILQNFYIFLLCIVPWKSLVSCPLIVLIGIGLTLDISQKNSCSLCLASSSLRVNLNLLFPSRCQHLEFVILFGEISQTILSSFIFSLASHVQPLCSSCSHVTVTDPSSFSVWFRGALTVKSLCEQTKVIKMIFRHTRFGV